MRKNLHDLERIERFINGELSNSERIIFENNLESDHGLADQLEAMKIVQTAACRYVLRQKVESIGNGGNSGTFKGIITSIIVLAAIAAGVFFVMQGDNEMLSDEETAIAETPVDANNVSAEQDEMPCSRLVELQTWVEPEVQQFSFTAEDGTLIEGENGVVIVIPRGGLMYENGEIVRGEVDFELIEALTIEEMVLYGLKTNSPQGVLGSGGMIHLAATANGQALKVNPDRPLYVEIPNPQLEPDMLAFEGVIDENSKISWENPKRLVKPLIPLPFDELDFLPEGFTEKVNSMMPMFGRDIATDDFVDSMYYLLNWTSSQVEDVFQLNSFQVETAEDSAAVDECGIHPSSIEAMVQPEFQKSFVATKDFEKRVAAIHKLTNGQEILNIYLANLDKDLFISDSIVSTKEINSKLEFFNFYKEKAGNVENADLYSEFLEKRYLKESQRLKALRRKIYDEKVKELRENSLNEIQLSRNQVTSVSPMPTYATQWFGMGWMNIDQYIKELSNGSRYVNIEVVDDSRHYDVTAWLPKINTYTDLNKLNSGYRAYYPSDYHRPVHVFAMDKSGDDFYWDFSKFKPKKTSKVTLEPKLTSEEEIRQELRSFGESWGRIKHERARIDAQRSRLTQSIAYVYSVSTRRESGGKMNKEESDFQRINCELKNAAFPCDYECPTEEPITETTELQTFLFVEDMPDFPGGNDALYNYLSKNVKYPKAAMDNKVEGTVYVTFVVQANGFVRDARVIRGLGHGCDETALEAVLQMPRWNPGMLRNQAVDVQYNLPVKFKLQ